jgi:hypothetical protein
VTTGMADHFNVKWRAGENPPDAYLQLPRHDVALEATRLEQVVIDERRGGYKPRRSEDTTAVILTNELDRMLRRKYPTARQ